MANMSYCRFENTYRDLEDCLDGLNEINGKLPELSSSEQRYAKLLIEMCEVIVENYGNYEDDDNKEGENNDE